MMNFWLNSTVHDGFGDQQIKKVSDKWKLVAM